MRLRSVLPAFLVLPLLPVLAACGADRVVEPEAPDAAQRVATVTFVAGESQSILGGRRSPTAFRIRAEDPSGRAVVGAQVRFAVEGEGGGILSQPRAVTDSIGEAETYILDAVSGSGSLIATSGGAEASIAFLVQRAPGEIRVEPGTGALGLPGKPHPDSLVRVQVLDTEGRPLEGAEVWFVGPPELSTVRDSTDAEGWASTILRRSQLSAGAANVIAFIVGFPEVTAFAPRPVEAPASRVVLISVDGLRGDAIARYAPPMLTRLAGEGAFTAVARTVLPSLTTPAHLSMFSSVAPTSHGIYGNELEFTVEMAELEPLFRYANRRGMTTQALLALEGPLAAFDLVLNCKLAFGLDSLTLAEPVAGAVADAARAALSNPDVELVFVHMPDPELAGQAFGWESAEYARAVHAVDSALVRMLVDVDSTTLVIITSDHGGGGAYGPYQTGSGSDADVLIPMILWGARAVPTALGSASILDVAPTVLWALGIRPPVAYRGRALLEGFR